MSDLFYSNKELEKSLDSLYAYVKSDAARRQKNQLIIEDEVVLLNVALKHTPKAKTNPFVIPIPHSLRLNAGDDSSSCEVCLFIRDPLEDYKQAFARQGFTPVTNAAASASLGNKIAVFKSPPSNVNIAKVEEEETKKTDDNDNDKKKKKKKKEKKQNSESKKRKNVSDEDKYDDDNNNDNKGNPSSLSSISTTAAAYTVTLVPISTLRSDFKQYESRRQLAKAYTHYLAEIPVLPMLSRLLGNAFLKRNKQPRAIELFAIDGADGASPWSTRLEAALDATSLVLGNGRLITARIGYESFSKSQIIDNVHTVLKDVVDRILKPGDARVIASLYLTVTPTSPSFTFYKSVRDATEPSPYVEELKPIEPLPEDIYLEEELGGEVLVDIDVEEEEKMRRKRKNRRFKK